MCIICVTRHYLRHRLNKDMLQPVPMKPYELRVSGILSFFELSPPWSVHGTGYYGMCMCLCMCIG